MPSPQIIGDIKPLSDLDKKVEINPNITPYLEYNQDLNIYKNGGLGGVGGANYETYGSKSLPLKGDDKSKDKSNYIENTGDPYIDAASRFGKEAEDLEKEMAKIGNDFAKKGTDGWYRPDERFGKLAKRLQTLLNILTALAMLMEAKYEGKRSVYLFWKPKEERAEDEGKQKSFLDIMSNSADKHAKASAQLAKGLSDYITKLNDDHKKELIKQAEKDAWNEAQSILNDIGDFFGLDSTNREYQELLTKKKEAIQKEFEKVQKEITKTFEKLKNDVAQAIRKDKSNPFGEKMAEVMDKTDESSLIKDAGNGYQDIDKDKALAHTKWFISLQNIRTAYYKLKMAKEKLREAQMKEFTGIERRGSVDQAFSKILSEVTVLERYFFVNYLNQVQTQIAAHNEYITAIFEREKAEEMNSFWTNPWFCLFVPIAGHLIFSSFYVKLVDWIRLECFYADHDNRFTPSELNMDNVYKIIDELADAKRELSHKTVDKVQKFFNEMEERIKKLEEELSKKGTMSAPDEMKAVNWNFINDVNEKYELIQRIVYGVMTLLLTKAKLASAVLKEEVPDVEWVKDAIKATFKNNRLALDFKIDTIKKKVEEHNRQRAQELEVEKVRDSAIGGIIGAAVAVILIAINVVSFGLSTPLTVLAYAGFIAACSAAGSAVGDLIFQYSHPVQDNIYKVKDFYKEILETDNPEKTFYKALDDIRERQRQNIDKINSNSFVDAGRDKRALDIKAVIRARDELTQDRIVEVAMLMIAKTQANIRAAMAARISGSPAVLADYDGIQASMEADYEGLLNAFEYKVLMANDEINLHNARIDQEKALSDAWISFGINTASAVCSVVSSNIGVNGLGTSSSYSQLIDAGAYGKVAVKAGLDATQIGLRTYELVRAYEYSQAKYGILLEDTKRLNELINEIYSMTEDIQDNNMRSALREAAKAANTNLVEGIGDGRVAVNVKYLFRILRKIESIYNAEIAKAMIENAKSQARAKTIGSISAGNEVIDALYQDMDRAKAVAQHLYQRLEDYVKFVNAVAEAKKQLVMKAAAYAVFIVGKADQILDGKITEGITKGVSKAIGKIFNIKDAENATLKIPLPSWLNKIAHPGKWISFIPKDLNLNDVVGTAVRVLLSENMAQRIALLATKQSEKGLDKKPQDVPEGPKSEAPARSEDASADALDCLEHEIALAEERIGDTGLSEAKFEVYKSLEQEFKNFLMQMIRETPQDYKAAEAARMRKYGKLPLLKENAEDLYERIKNKLAEPGKIKPAEIKELRAELNGLKREIRNEEIELNNLKRRADKQPDLKGQVAKRAEMIKELKVFISRAEADLRKIAPVPPPAQAPQQAQEVSLKEFKKIEKNTSVLQRRVEQLLAKVESQLQAAKQNGGKPVNIEDLRAELARLKDALKQEEAKLKSLRQELESSKSRENMLEKQIARLSAKLDAVKSLCIKGDSKLEELGTLLAELDIMHGGKKVRKQEIVRMEAEVKDSQGKVKDTRGQIASVSAAITQLEQEERRKKERPSEKYDPTDAVANVLRRDQLSKAGFCA